MYMDDMAVEVEDSFASEAADLTDMMEIAPDVLGNDTEMGVLSSENSVEDRITSLQDFSDTTRPCWTSMNSWPLSMIWVMT